MVHGFEPSGSQSGRSSRFGLAGVAIILQLHNLVPKTFSGVDVGRACTDWPATLEAKLSLRRMSRLVAIGGDLSALYLQHHLRLDRNYSGNAVRAVDIPGSRL